MAHCRRLLVGEQFGLDKPAQPQKVTGEDGGPVQIAVSMADVPWRKSSK
jgi:hypothetical protein